MQMNRRGLLKAAGAGTAVAAGAAIPVFSRLRADEPDVYQFRATLGLPERPLPNYATLILEGSVNLAKGTGMVASRLQAGHPGVTSDIGLPGLGRIISVTGVEQSGALLTIRGLIEDRSQLEPGESHQVELVIDRARGVARAPFGSKTVELTLA